MDVAQPSLDQLRIFLAVVDEGSFNRAAAKLGRAISVVSYGIANLEAQLGVTLFDREGSRRPQLTEDGKALRFYEVTEFAFHLTPDTVAAAVPTLTPDSKES